MKTAKLVLIGVTLACFSLSSLAADLVVTVAEGNAKSASPRMGLDVSTEGSVSGFNFLVSLPAGLKLGSVDVSKCLSDLPKGFSGDCRQTEKGVFVFAMTNDGSALPAGVVSVGSLGLPAGLAKSESIGIEQLVFADVNGDAINSSHQIAR